MNTVLAERHIQRRTHESPVLTGVSANGTLAGLLFELVVEQKFVNAGNENIEAVYTFPLPYGAVLMELECKLGERVLHGTVVAKVKAQERYEAAIEAGDSAIMLERSHADTYTINIGNLMAGETASFQYRYCQLLSFAQGGIRLAIPATIAPRYGSPLRAGLAHHQIPDNDLLADYPFALTIALHGDVAGGAVSSPSHMISMRQHEGTLALVLPGTARMDRDFVLNIDGLAGKSLAVSGADDEGMVVLASFCPQGEAGATMPPLAIKILLDCSGSMQGNNIDCAQRALHEVLGGLAPTDRFSFSRFGDGVVHQSATLMEADEMAIREGATWIAQARADMGGTNMGRALLNTFALCKPEAADILLVTDGAIWETEQIIADASCAGQRIFAVGIGAAPATSLLRSLAEATGGACEFIDANDDVHAAILRMARRIRQPQVRDLAVLWARPASWKTSPGKALFVGETVHAFAGFAGAGRADAELSWVEGEKQHRLSLDGDPVVLPGATLARLAAAMRLRAAGAEEREALALRYQLVTDCTNFLIVHHRADGERSPMLPSLRRVDHMAVAGLGGTRSMRRDGMMQPPALWRREQASIQIQSEDNPVLFSLGRNDNANKFVHRAALIACLEIVNSDGTPPSWEVLAAELPSQVVGPLQILIDEGGPCAEVVSAFMDALRDCVHPLGPGRRLLRSIRVVGAGQSANALRRKVAAVVKAAFNESSLAHDIPAFLRKQAD